MSKDIEPVVGKARVALFNKMTEPTKALAKEWEKSLGAASAANMKVLYEIGAQVIQVAENESEYGSDAISQLAAYHNIPGGRTTLYNLRSVVTTFERDFVLTNSRRAFANGTGYMESAHWIQLAKIADEQTRNAMIERVIDESMSSRDLEREIQVGLGGKTKNVRKGGRKPKAPSSPIIGLRRTFELGNKFTRWGDVTEKAVFDPLTEMDEDKISDGLLENAHKALDMLAKVETRAAEMRKQLAPIVSRFDKMAGKNAAKKTKEKVASYSEDEDAPKKKLKKFKKLKKKSKKPVAAE